jgi:epoxide hydrolase
MTSNTRVPTFGRQVSDRGHDPSACARTMIVMTTPTISPFTIEVPSDVLDDLRERLARTRWPNERGDGRPGTGPTVSRMRQLVDHWLHRYDWAAEQAELNAVPHVVADFDGQRMHAIHARAERPDATPLLLLHGWADSFVRYRHVIAPLTQGDPGFHVVVPSLPGFDFSDQPDGDLDAVAIAGQLLALMTTLGHDRFVLHGGDWGSVVGQEVARLAPERVIGMHLIDVPFSNVFMVDRADVAPDELAYLEHVDAWGESDGAYVSIQSARPLLLSYALSDSPVGLLAWLVDHLDRLATTPPSDDDLITNAMTYWVANAMRSSLRLYSEGAAWDDEGESDWSASPDAEGDAANEWAATPDADAPDASGVDAGTAASEWGDVAGWNPRIEVPTALQVFPQDIGMPPRAFAERFFDVRRYTVAEAGGHFAALEVPDAVVADLRAFTLESLG